MRDFTERLRQRFHARFSTVTDAQINRAFNRAREDLWRVGLLEDGRYLDRIDCIQSSTPRFWCRELGFVYDRGVPLEEALLGYRTGVIYIRLRPPIEAYVPGGTLVDTIRHEFAHAWAWLDARYIDRPWFRKAFGHGYDDDWSDGKPEFDEADFVSEYACEAPKEDFAETFMVYLRCHRSLDQFRARRGVYRKLKAVERAVAVAASERVQRIRGPR